LEGSRLAQVISQGEGGVWCAGVGLWTTRPMILRSLEEGSECYKPATLYIRVFLSFSSVYSGMLWYALVCSGMLWYGLVCSGMLWNALVCSGILWYALECSGMLCYALVCCSMLGMLWYALVYCGMLWYALVCSGMLWYVRAGLRTGETSLPCVSWRSRHDSYLPPQ
jgi:hypothetical protein